ncbi:hypothetical protein GCM10009859_01030 [Kocuria salsicia]
MGREPGTLKKVGAMVTEALYAVGARPLWGAPGSVARTAAVVAARRLQGLVGDLSREPAARRRRGAVGTIRTVPGNTKGGATPPTLMGC